MHLQVCGCAKKLTSSSEVSSLVNANFLLLRDLCLVLGRAEKPTNGHNNSKLAINYMYEALLELKSFHQPMSKLFEAKCFDHSAVTVLRHLSYFTAYLAAVEMPLLPHRWKPGPQL